MHPPFPIDETFDARIQDAYRFGAAPTWNGVDGGQSLLEQIEPLLGEGAEPDPTFFVESWTVGVAAASENYSRRRQHQNRRPEPVVWPCFSSFTPLFMTESASPVQYSDHRVSRDEGDEAEIEPMPRPLNFEAACRLLGVAVNSTRDQIKAAYRKMANRYHPDHTARSGAHAQKIASDRMAVINEAYRMLCEAPLG
ncbi:MAG TPA: J domain-containing protein [Bryobacteraceae bacterium]|nr:J domain-containing protein [Bryobacteraceae bacterium]